MTITYHENALTADNYRAFQQAMGWKPENYQVITKSLAHDLYDVVAMDGARIVGMGRLVGDAAIYWYIQDLFILTDYQHKGIGTQIVRRLIDHIKTNSLPNTQLVLSLMSAPGKEGFYEKLGFTRRPHPSAGAGMELEITIP